MANPEHRWPRGLRERILQRDNNTCRIGLPGCTTQAECVDHILPASKGGQYFDPANLRAACNSCNLLRTRRNPRPTLPRAAEHW